MLHLGKLSVDGISIALDDASSDVCFVSHAHSDHTSAFGKDKRIIASEETFSLMGKTHQPHGISGIRLAPAGHMLGARQLVADTPLGKFAYTGDFSLTDSYTSRAAEIVRCDTLMIDSTYCQRHMKIPTRFEVMEAMAGFVKRNSGSILVFGAYNTGKAQELTCFLNRECGIAPIVNDKAARVCSAYGKCGVKMEYVRAGSDEAEEAMRHPFVAIQPPSVVNFDFGARLSSAFGRTVLTAVATGWAAFNRFPVDKSFALSDHADFGDTMRYINESGAKTIICANSGAASAANYLRNAGYNAMTKEETAQGVQSVLA